MTIHSPPWCSSFLHLPSYTISRSSSVSQIVSSLLLLSPQLLLWHGPPPFSWHAYPIWTFSSPGHSTCSPHHTFSSPHLMPCLSISHTPCTSACCSHFSLASSLTLSVGLLSARNLVWKIILSIILAHTIIKLKQWLISLPSKLPRSWLELYKYLSELKQYLCAIWIEILPQFFYHSSTLSNMPVPKLGINEHTSLMSTWPVLIWTCWSIYISVLIEAKMVL